VLQAAEFWARVQGSVVPAGRSATLHSAVSPDSVLLYCYTGGTTKHSKCVVVTHAMALWEMENYSAVAGNSMSHTDRVLQYTSAFWGAAAFGQIDIALAFGACTVFVPSAKGVDWIAAAVEQRRISVLGTVPSQMRGAYPGGPSSAPRCLRVIFTWGEKLPVKLSKPWRERCNVFELLIATEYWLALFSDCSTWLDPADNQEKPILQKLPRLEMALLDEDLRPVPEGQEGELVLVGPTVSPGYLDSNGRVGTGPENKSYAWRGGRLHFHTSDRLRSLPAGGFVYCGRAGALAKRGGAWVDLEAIEAAVGAVPGVCSAAVLGGDQVDIFVSFEPWSGEKTLCGVLDDVRRAAGGVCRVHARSELPLHPATAKVDRRRLKAELDEVRVREADHLARLASLQRKMLWSYCSWYAVPLSLLAVWTLLACALMPLVRVVDVLLARVLMLPYMWAALLYSILDPTRGVNFFQRPIGVPDFVLLLAMAVPHAPWCLGAATAASCAVVVWRRDKDVLAAGSFAALGIALWAAAGAQHLSCCASLLTCFIVAAVCAPKQLGFLAGLPVCFYVVLPKWLGDDWLWRVRCDESHLRRFLMRVMVAAERPSWDASLAWDDARSNAYWQNDYVQSCVRVKEECNGLAKAVDSLWEIPPVSSYTKATNGSSDKEREVHQGSAAADAPALSTAAASLAALVERAGGNPYALGSMDSLQAITLAELIRREIGLQMPVSSVLNCADVVQLAQRAEEASQVLDKGINGATSTRARPRLGEADSVAQPDSQGAYRVFALAFPRHPVDWCVRYSGPGHLDVNALQRALDRLVARHSALRTVQTPDEPLRELMDKVAGMWQLWSSCCGSDRRYWKTIAQVFGGAAFACWPRTVTRSPAQARVELKFPVGPKVREELWDSFSDDEYIHSAMREVIGEHRWPFDVAVVPLYRGVPEGAGGKTAVELATQMPPESVAWYIYFGITHAYSDGASGQALFNDLLGFYAEECGRAPAAPRPEAPEPMALLQRRLRTSLNGRTRGHQPDPNHDVYHEVVCEDYGKRPGISSRIFFGPRLMRSFRASALESLGCGIDVAWLTVVLGTMFRLFPEERRITLMLKVGCRDGPGEVQMVGFLSEQRVLPVDLGDPENSTLLDIVNVLSLARRGRAWRAPQPYESGLCVYVNIVGAMVDGLPQGFRHVVKAASAPTNWRGMAYAHLNLRIDQLSASEWDFRVFHHDMAWGWDWMPCFAQELGAVIGDMAMAPTASLLRPPRYRPTRKRQSGADGDAGREESAAKAARVADA